MELNDKSRESIYKSLNCDKSTDIEETHDDPEMELLKIDQRLRDYLWSLEEHQLYSIKWKSKTHKANQYRWGKASMTTVI